MQVYSYYLFKVIEAFIIAFAGGLVATPFSIRLAKKYDIMDHPKDDRRMHTKAIPRFGGMGIFVGSMLGMLIGAGMNPLIKTAMIGGALMYLIGAADDFKPLAPMVKFGAQWLVATLMYAMGIRITFITNFFGAGDVNEAKLIFGAGVAYFVTVIWIVGVTNAVNLMDGLDGLAAGSAAIMSLSLAYIAYIHGVRLGMMPVCFALTALAGGCFGFLPYNFSPAKTFMGDSGALYLGYMIAVLSVISPLKKATMIGAIIPILALAVPIFDTVFAMVRRIAKGTSIMTADKGHLHHHLVASGYGQRRSVMIIYGIVGTMGVAAVLMSRGLYKDAFFLVLIACNYLMIIIVPKQPKKGSLMHIRKYRNGINKSEETDNGESE